MATGFQIFCKNYEKCIKCKKNIPGKKRTKYKNYFFKLQKKYFRKIESSIFAIVQIMYRKKKNTVLKDEEEKY